MIIAIGGKHGTGKSTCAKALAEAYGLRYVSAGETFRRIARERGISIGELSKLSEEDPSIDRLVDEKTREEARKGDVVLEGQLAPWLAEGSLKIYVTAPTKERILRISMRDSLSYEEAERETIRREASEKKRYEEYYGIDVDDLSIYDLIVDTGLFSKEETVKILKEVVDTILKLLPGGKV